MKQKADNCYHKTTVVRRCTYEIFTCAMMESPLHMVQYLWKGLPLIVKSEVKSLQFSPTRNTSSSARMLECKLLLTLKIKQLLFPLNPCHPPYNAHTIRSIQQQESSFLGQICSDKHNKTADAMKLYKKCLFQAKLLFC